MLCVTIQVTIHYWDDGEKTNDQSLPGRFCQHPSASQRHVKRSWRLTRHLLSDRSWRGERRQRHSVSDRRSQSVLFQAANKEKAKGIIQSIKEKSSGFSRQCKFTIYILTPLLGAVTPHPAWSRGAMETLMSNQHVGYGNVNQSLQPQQIHLLSQLWKTCNYTSTGFEQALRKLTRNIGWRCGVSLWM